MTWRAHATQLGRLHGSIYVMWAQPLGAGEVAYGRGNVTGMPQTGLVLDRLEDIAIER